MAHLWQLSIKNGLKKRSFKYGKELLEASKGYFEHVDKNPWITKELVKVGKLAGVVQDVEVQRPYTVSGLCLHIGISKRTFYNYLEDKEKYKSVHEASVLLKTIIDTQKYEGAAINEFNSNFIARDLKIYDGEKSEETVQNIIIYNGKEIQI